eukprot:3067886-Rhodomonas_salina.2
MSTGHGVGRYWERVPSLNTHVTSPPAKRSSFGLLSSVADSAGSKVIVWPGRRITCISGPGLLVASA